ncbi:hypothetical protein DIPPA_32640, partial [Diplonema papillatum]
VLGVRRLQGEGDGDVQHNGGAVPDIADVRALPLRVRKHGALDRRGQQATAGEVSDDIAECVVHSRPAPAGEATSRMHSVD